MRQSADRGVQRRVRRQTGAVCLPLSCHHTVFACRQHCLTGQIMLCRVHGRVNV